MNTTQSSDQDTPGSRFGLFVLEGEPFETPGVPVDALFELVIYRTLIVDVAKQCFLRDNPRRVRSQRNMERDFDLRLVEVKQGSSNLLLERTPVSELNNAGPAAVFNDYFDESRDLITTAISEVGQTGRLPNEFPTSSLSKFRNLGRTLTPGSRIKTGRVDGSDSAYFTPATRDAFQKLIEEMSQISHQEIIGRIVEIDTERLVFHLRTAEGVRIQCSYSSGHVTIPHELLTDETGNGPLVVIEGEALVDDEGDVQRFEFVRRVRPFRTTRIIEQIQKLTELPPGWLGEADSVPVKQSIAGSVSSLLEQPHELPETLAPAPLPDGGIRFEWTINELDYILEINPDNSIYMCILAEDAEDDVDTTLDTFNGDAILHLLKEGTLD